MVFNNEVIGVTYAVTDNRSHRFVPFLDPISLPQPQYTVVPVHESC